MSAPKPELTDTEAAQAIVRALADPHRYRIVSVLAQTDGEMQCSAVLEQIPVTPPTFSHHMHELHNAGLVTMRRTGRTISYSLRREVLQAFLEVLERDLLPLRSSSKKACIVPSRQPSIR